MININGIMVVVDKIAYIDEIISYYHADNMRYKFEVATTGGSFWITRPNRDDCDKLRKQLIKEINDSKQ